MGTGTRLRVDILEEIGFERDSRVPYKLASALPTGYLKRLELARCIALRPEIIFCDEVFRPQCQRGCRHRRPSPKD